MICKGEGDVVGVWSMRRGKGFGGLMVLDVSYESWEQIEGNNTILLRTYTDLPYNIVDQRCKLEA